jgi:hypothetical protein
MALSVSRPHSAARIATAAPLIGETHRNARAHRGWKVAMSHR